MSSRKNKIFYADAAKGYTIKVLFDVLSNPLSRVTLNLTKEGIFIRRMDQAKSILFNASLYMQNFRTYICKEPKRISLNLKHLQSLIKNVKKKDVMIIFMDKSKPGKLGFAIRDGSKKSTRTETVYFTIQEETINDDPNILELEERDEEKVYEFPKVIESSDFQKIKKMSQVGKEITIKMHGSDYISFYCESGCYSDELEFGEIIDDSEEESSEESESESEEDEMYQADFKANHFSMLVKLPGLCSQMQFYAPKFKGYPLKISMPAGTGQSILGEVQVYIKDVDQIREMKERDMYSQAEGELSEDHE